MGSSIVGIFGNYLVSTFFFFYKLVFQEKKKNVILDMTSSFAKKGKEDEKKTDA